MALARKRTRRHPDRPTERRTECAGGLIPDGVRHLAQRQAVMPQQVLGQRHPPPQHIFHRRNAQYLREPRREGRARHADLGGQVRNRPAPGHVVVNMPQCLRQARIRQPCQQSCQGRGFLRGSPSQRLDQHHFDQPHQDGVGARSRLGGLFANRAGDPAQPGAARV
ncbi:hypothetical protein G6F22_019446 [Rhizopus arrhizus]|nr:hypothetical protein G6F22_019446 [Rhizopus arrhizus]